MKNPQLLSNRYEPWGKYTSLEWFMMLEYQLDWIKIVDFSLIAKFLASPDNHVPPSKYHLYFTSSYETCGAIEGLANNIAGICACTSTFAGFIIKRVSWLV